MTHFPDAIYYLIVYPTFFRLETKSVWTNVRSSLISTREGDSLWIGSRLVTGRLSFAILNLLMIWFINCNRCAMRAGSRLLSGASMEDNSMLCEYTLVASGDVADSDIVYYKWPAERLDLIQVLISLFISYHLSFILFNLLRSIEHQYKYSLVHPILSYKRHDCQYIVEFKRKKRVECEPHGTKRVTPEYEIIGIWYFEAILTILTT